MQTCFWLNPSTADRELLARRIDGLADRFGATQFEPHLTIGACPEKEIAEPAKVLLALCQSVQAFALQPQALGTSERFTMTFFIKFGLEPPLVQLRQRWRDFLKNPPEEQFTPHVSLLYASLAEEERQTLLHETECPREKIHFDSISILQVPDQIRSPAEVAGWQVLARAPLRE